MQSVSQKRGFTLIELLVVIAIISLFSSIVLSSLSLAQAKARDSRRLTDLRQIVNAIELYRSNNSSYPSTSGSWWGNCAGFGSRATSGATAYVPNVAPTYIKVLPTDPKPIAPNNCYLYSSNGSDYMIMAYGTVETYSSANNPAPRPFDTNEADFAFYTAGAAQW
ncbi:MAG: hypothetical protein ABA06_00105 [Parcubacteria bacterium C7867-001]|nr:MAG: hypothetical protein ABA06_00105 [Parcubacteria bacterium C7867-001]